MGGGCGPSCAKRGKLKHKLTLVFPKSHLSNTLGGVVDQDCMDRS